MSDDNTLPQVEPDTKPKSKDVFDEALKKLKSMIESGDLVLPQDYNLENAFNAAKLKLHAMKIKNTQSQYVSILTIASYVDVYSSLLDMGIQALNPGKNQCYFISNKHGKFEMRRSYFGTQMIVKRQCKAKDIRAVVIYEDDIITYEIENSLIVNVKHSQKFGSIKTDKIKGAYCEIVFQDFSYIEIMTNDQIKQSWSQSIQKGVQATFPEEMTKRTVIARTCKGYMNTSLDNDVLVDAFNRTTANEFKEENSKEEAKTDSPLENKFESISPLEKSTEEKKIGDANEG
jgi:recombination protein RecT